jgi:hypothetical protein
MTVRCSRFTEIDGKKQRMWEKTFRFPLERLFQETEKMRKRIDLIKRREKSRQSYFRPQLELQACGSCPRRGDCEALLRNAPLLALVKAEELRTGRRTAFVDPEPTVAPDNTEVEAVS